MSEQRNWLAGAAGKASTDTERNRKRRDASISRSRAQARDNFRVSTGGGSAATTSISPCTTPIVRFVLFIFFVFFSHPPPLQFPFFPDSLESNGIWNRDTKHAHTREIKRDRISQYLIERLNVEYSFFVLLNLQLICDRSSSKRD